ncbi:MAG: TetR family transcriptional regulator [Alphaproteobacteria bacterium]|nr:TetR family transcriptional regulator [Alphaproteobacteria bacterium]
MARKTKDEAEKTRDAILDAAERIFHAHGVSRTSLEEIAADAGVTRGAVYWHFKDKAALCEAMVERVFLPHEDMLEKLAAQPSAEPLKDLQKACLHSLSMMAKDKRRRNVVSILTLRCEYVEEMIGIMERRNQCKSRMLFLSEKLFTHARKLKMLAPQWTPRKAAVALQALMSGLISGGLEKRAHFNFVPMGTSCVEAFFKSLRAR